MLEFISQPWPWYVAGPIIGLIVPALLIVGGKQFGISENLRHICAASAPAGVPFFDYDWKSGGMWNLTFIVGVTIGAFLTALLLPGDGTVAVSEATRSDLAALGIADFDGLAPREIFSFEALLSLRGFVSVVIGGFLVGFGARYAGGCNSGHAISGLSNLQLPSMLAVAGFFVGGLITTWVVLPILF
jgi:hypothetical protein